MQRNRVRLAAGLIVLAAFASVSAIAAAAPPPQERQVHALATGWRFRFEGDASGVTDPAYDDRAWTAVSLPHTWNRVGEYGFSPSPAMNNAHGVGWYRLHLPLSASATGRHQFLQFDAVGNIADVWVNGAHVGRHEGAFSRFRFDVTAALKPGADNVIVVRADNSKPAPGSTTENVIPLGGDFFIHGGLYRQVSLIQTDSAQIDLLDHGGPGVYISTPEVAADQAQVSVLTRLRNLATSPRAL